jgi:outer membrane protein OmpA-like peptidoglycan-associated protein
MPVLSQSDDAEGCKDHPLFNRMPNFHISECQQSQFELKKYPMGPPLPVEGDDPKPKTLDVEGPFFRIRYELKEGVTPPSPLQTMRNFANAGKAAGATLLGEYPGWCKAAVDETIDDGNNCILYGVSLKFGGRGAKETIAFIESEDNDGKAYAVHISEREAMTQDIAANYLRDAIYKDGFVAVNINFDTGSAKIQETSMSQIEQIAQMLQSSPDLKIEIGGHTDSVGTPESNLKLSDARAKSVMEALIARKIAPARLTAQGYGQTAPVADNRTEEGRARNRRVELVKK